MKFLELLDQATVIVPVYRNHLSVEKHFDLCLFAMTFTWIYCSKVDHAPDRLHPTRHSNSFAFADIRRTIASERPELSDNEKRIRFNTHSA